MQERVDVDAGDFGTERGQESQVADRAVTEVEDFQAGDVFQPRTAEHVERPRVGQRRAVFCIPVERIVEIDALELGLLLSLVRGAAAASLL